MRFYFWIKTSKDHSNYYQFYDEKKTLNESNKCLQRNAHEKLKLISFILLKEGTIHILD